MAKSTQMDWEDLRVFLAVARTGSARKASDSLSMHYTSVIRRISGLETAMAAQLFDKSPKGYALTELGHSILDYAENMEGDALAITRKLHGADSALSGVLRVAMTTTVASYLLMDDLRAFSEAYPDVELDLRTNTSFADLSRGEAHVTVRVSDNPGDHLVGRRYATYYEAVYASPEYLKHNPLDTQDTQARWLHWLKGKPFENYIAKSEFPHITRTQSISDEVVLLNAARAGMGIATMPCFYGDADPALERVGTHPPQPCLGIWLLTHPDLTKNARVRTFTEFIGKALEHKRLLLAGELAV